MGAILVAAVLAFTGYAQAQATYFWPVVGLDSVSSSRRIDPQGNTIHAIEAKGYVDSGNQPGVTWSYCRLDVVARCTTPINPAPDRGASRRYLATPQGGIHQKYDESMTVQTPPPTSDTYDIESFAVFVETGGTPHSKRSGRRSVTVSP